MKFEEIKFSKMESVNKYLGVERYFFEVPQTPCKRTKDGYISDFVRDCSSRGFFMLPSDFKSESDILNWYNKELKTFVQHGLAKEGKLLWEMDVNSMYDTKKHTIAAEGTLSYRIIPKKTFQLYHSLGTLGGF